MDAQVREDSQRRSSIKRPWDEDAASVATKSNGWHGALLPSIDAVPTYHRPQVPRRAEPAPALHNGYDRESAGQVSKRPRYEWSEHNPLSGDAPAVAATLNGKLPTSRPPARKLKATPWQNIRLLTSIPHARSPIQSR